MPIVCYFFLSVSDLGDGVLIGPQVCLIILRACFRFYFRYKYFYWYMVCMISYAMMLHSYIHVRVLHALFCLVYFVSHRTLHGSFRFRNLILFWCKWTWCQVRYWIDVYSFWISIWSTFGDPKN